MTTTRPCAGFLLPSIARDNGVKQYLRIFSDESFSIAVFSCVFVVCIFGFFIGAEPYLLLVMLFVGMMTAIAEYRMRLRRRGGSK